MLKMDYNVYVVDVETVAGLAGCVSGMLVLLALCCCSSKRDVKAVDTHERNSKLAFMLMLILLENKDNNRKYRKMAEIVGYDHIMSPDEFGDTDSESE